MSSARITLASLVTGLALVAAPALAFTPPASAAKAKSCSASVSDSRPHRGQFITVTVKKLATGATVTATAKYKTTKTSKTAKAKGKGIAKLGYNIGGGTYGRKVPVSVVATKGKTVWTCSTSFTPSKKS